ncbi:radical SAM protein [Vallitalea sediminicola]
MKLLDIPKNTEEKVEYAKQLIYITNKNIRDGIEVRIGDIDFSKAGDCVAREGSIEGEAIKRAIITLRGNGCEWAREQNGGCTMCGHLSGSSRGTKISEEKIKKQFDDSMESFDFSRHPMLCLYNGGSFLNENEISKELRQYMFKRISEVTDIKTLIIESRPIHVTDEVLDEIERLLPNIVVEVGIGLESSNDIVRNVILNKGTELEEYEKVSAKFKHRKIKLLMYVLIKAPFLTEREAIDDAIATIEFAHKIGVDNISLEPVSIQEETFIDYLSKLGHYRAPWIWTVFEIIKKTYHLGLLMRIGGFQFFPIPKQYTSNCPDCDEEMILKIKEFNETNDIKVIEGLKCKSGCDKKWMEEVQKIDNKDILDRVISLIEAYC